MWEGYVSAAEMGSPEIDVRVQGGRPGPSEEPVYQGHIAA